MGSSSFGRGISYFFLGELWIIYANGAFPRSYVILSKILSSHYPLWNPKISSWYGLWNGYGAVKLFWPNIT